MGSWVMGYRRLDSRCQSRADGIMLEVKYFAISESEWPGKSDWDIQVSRVETGCYFG